MLAQCMNCTIIIPPVYSSPTADSKRALGLRDALGFGRPQMGLKCNYFVVTIRWKRGLVAK